VQKSKTHKFGVSVERDEGGYYVASVPELRGCHTPARSLDKLIKRVRKAIELCLEVESNKPATAEFGDVQQVAV
jgi:predicted RNase H-like HicB family nuclease